jgi:hypothetical protein
VWSGRSRVRFVDPHTRQTVKTDEFDHTHDLRLSAAQAQSAASAAQPIRQKCKIDHQRRIREDEFAEIDDDVGLRTESADESPAPQGLCTSVLIPGADQHRRVVRELDDGRNLYDPTVVNQPRIFDPVSAGS